MFEYFTRISLFIVNNNLLRITMVDILIERSWSEWFWLPENYRWQDLEYVTYTWIDSTEYITHSAFCGLIYLLVKRYIFFPLLLTPIAVRAGVRSKPYPPPAANAHLECLYENKKARPPKHMILEAAEKLCWPPRRIERWLRQKALSQQVTTLEKFNEIGFRLAHYTLFSIAGLIIILPQDFLLSPYEYLSSYPDVAVSSPVWAYCVVGNGFYFAHTIAFLTSHRKHDFFQTLVHHMMVFFLSFFSVSQNLLSLYALGLFTHEFADIPLLLGKLFFYAKKTTYSDNCVLIFAIVWVMSRLIAYPLLVLVPYYYLPQNIGKPRWPAATTALIYIFILMGLHLIWTYELVAAIGKKFTSTKPITDERSSPDDLSEEDDNQRNENNFK